MTTEFTYQQIENDPTMQKFLKKKTGTTQSTQRGYIFAIKDFCNFTGKTPTEIHDIHKTDLRNNKAEFDQWLNEAFEDYITHLIEEGKQHGGIKWNVSKVKSFLHAFKLRPTPTTEISKKQVKEDSKYLLKKEDIQKAIRHSLPLYQTLFITQAQTGLSISDALLLDVEDFISAVSKEDEKLSVREAIYRAKKEDNIIGCFDLRRKKTSQEFYTFIGPEALRSIAEFLETRDIESLKPDSPIFIKDNSKISKSRENAIKDIRLTRSAVMKYVERMHIDRQIFPKIRVDGKEKNYFRTHKLRKWFSNQLRFKAGFSSDDVKYLMGQKTGDVLEHYIDPNNYNALKGNYRKALPHLSITDEIVLEENQEAIERLEDNIKAKEKQIEILEKKVELMEKLFADEDFSKRRSR